MSRSPVTTSTEYGAAYLVREDDGSRFHYTRKGNAIYFHIDSANPRGFERSAERFINWALDSHNWCKMLLITTEKRSIKRIAERLGFVRFLENGDAVAMMRLKDG